MTILIILLLIVLGVVMLLLEFAVIPGFTIFGIGGIAMLGYSVYLAFARYGASAGIITVIVIITLIPIIFLKFLKSKAGKKMQLDSTITGKVNVLEKEKFKVGDRGKAITRLAVIGKVEFNGIIVEGKSTGDFIEDGSTVEIVAIMNNQLIVKQNKLNTMVLPNTIGILIAIVVGLILLLYFIPIGIWFSALVSGVQISLTQLFLMRFRKVPPGVITRAMIEAHKAGLEGIKRDELEAHFLAGGHVENVVHALVSAEKANIPLTFKMATAIDLAGRDVLQAVRMSVNPKVIDTPPVSAVAKDGIQLICKARVTVRAQHSSIGGRCR